MHKPFSVGHVLCLPADGASIDRAAIDIAINVESMQLADLASRMTGSMAILSLAGEGPPTFYRVSAIRLRLGETVRVAEP